MLPIITVTVSPCIDISTSVPELTPERKLHCGEVKKEPGGGGINVSRVLSRLGCPTTAIYLAGGYTGSRFSSMMQDENVNTIVIDTKNDTRENFVVAEKTTGRQYRFGMPGPLIYEEEWKLFLELIVTLEDIECIVASGSLTAGVPVNFFAKIAAIAKQKNIPLFLDSSGEALKAALAEGVYMIKPNMGELASLSGIKELTKETAIIASKMLIQKQQCELVLVSMGADGALLVSADEFFHLKAPGVKINSTVGAGDSMMAGFVKALLEKKSLKESLNFAVACGTAATMKDGTALCDYESINEIIQLINNDKQIKQ